MTDEINMKFFKKEKEIIQTSFDDVGRPSAVIRRSLVRCQLSGVLRRQGFSLVEVILASSIFALMITAFVGAYLYGEEATSLAGRRARAVLLAEEGLEATRNIRDAGFANLIDGQHGLSTAGNQWSFSTTTQDVQDIFTRQVTIGTVDTKRKIATSTVTWQQNQQRGGSVTLVTRLTNWLVSVGIGNWANATTTTSMDFAGNNDGLRIKVSGNYAYVVRNNGTPDFLVIDVTDPANPTLAGSLNLTGVPTDIAVSGNYAYVTNTSNTQELQIIDISNPLAPSVAGTYDASGNTNANGVFANGTTVYIVRTSGAADEFLVVDASVPASVVLVGSVDLGATGNEVAVVGSYAYVASGNNAQELQVVDISTPATPQLVGSLNLAGNTDALTVAAFGTTVVIGQGNNLYTVDVASPTAPAQLGSIGTGGVVNDISIEPGNTYAFIADSNTSGEFQVIDMTTLSAPSIFGLINIPTASALFGVAYDTVKDRVYAVGSTDTQEFFVFAPQ